MSEQPVDAPELESLRLLEYGSEYDLVEAATAYAKAALPEWEPRAGNTEVVLMEALALMLGPAILGLQMLGPVVTEQLMKLYGVERDQGQAATSRVRFTVNDANPTQTVPAATRLRLTVASTGETVDVLTVEELNIITSETLTGEVDVILDETGIIANGTPPGVPLDVVDNLPFIDSVVLAAPVDGGTELESDASFNARAASTFGRFASTLVYAEHFEFAALSRVDVGRAMVADLYDPTTGTEGVAGHVTVAVADKTGAPLSAEIMQEIDGWLTSQSLASLNVHVIAPTYTPFDLAVSVKKSFGYTAAEVQANVETALRTWLSPLRWDWSPTVRQYSMVSVVASTPGVAEVTAVPADLVLTGKAPLPTLGTVTVTVSE